MITLKGKANTSFEHYECKYLKRINKIQYKHKTHSKQGWNLSSKQKGFKNNPNDQCNICSKWWNKELNEKKSDHPTNQPHK